MTPNTLRLLVCSTVCGAMLVSSASVAEAKFWLSSSMSGCTRNRGGAKEPRKVARFERASAWRKAPFQMHGGGVPSGCETQKASEQNVSVSVVVSVVVSVLLPHGCFLPGQLGQHLNHANNQLLGAHQLLG
jgi:hypothetical protein